MNKYSEDLYSISMKQLDTIGMNPWAMRLMLKSYKADVGPKPVTIDYHIIAEQVGNEDIIKDAPEKEIELYIATPGYLGKGRGKVGDMDKYAIREVCRAYYRYFMPSPMSFIFGGIEFHFRSSKLSDHEAKNVTRNIFDPTANHKQMKKHLQK